MKWAYGVTTVKERLYDLLPKTLESLGAAGFDRPRLFIDDPPPFAGHPKELPTTYRHPRIRTYGNWILAVVELVCREPLADRYAIFQDDILALRNLRQYLEKCRYPDRGYLNLYTFPCNQAKFPPDDDPHRRFPHKTGWFLSNQRGLGALGLVFSQDVAYKLLGSPHSWTRMRDPVRGPQAVDGGVVTALAHQGIKEYVHNPTLLQHTGTVSTMAGHTKTGPQLEQQTALYFQGTDFDALTLLSAK